MDDRQYIEEQIIGMALQHEGLAIIAMDIVGPANFENPLCKQIAEVFNVLIRRNTIIDIVSVTLAHRRMYDNTSPYAITNLADKSVGISLKDKCLLLLQMDIKKKALATCQLYEKEASKNQLFEKAAIWKQCHDHLANPETDILEQLPIVYKYIGTYMEDGAEEFQMLVDAIPKVAKRILGTDRLDHLLKVLKVIGRQTLSRDREEILNMLSEIISHTVSGAPLPPQLFNQISQINESIHERNHTT